MLLCNNRAEAAPFPPQATLPISSPLLRWAVVLQTEQSLRCLLKITYHPCTYKDTFYYTFDRGAYKDLLVNSSNMLECLKLQAVSYIKKHRSIDANCMIHIDTTLLRLLLIVTAIAKEQARSERICIKYKRLNKNFAARKIQALQPFRPPFPLQTPSCSIK
jgi:hypothetical protein